MELLQKHCSPSPSIIVEKFKFNSSNHDLRESGTTLCDISQTTDRALQLSSLQHKN